MSGWAPDRDAPVIENEPGEVPEGAINEHHHYPESSLDF